MQSEYVSIPHYRTLVIKGYFQNEIYFKHLRNELLTEFQFPNLDDINSAIAMNIEAHNDSVCIHVRRGDYLLKHNLQIHGLLSLNYYQAAIKTIKSNLRNPHYFIFSDDYEWCRQAFSGISENMSLVTGNDKEAWKDLKLMSLCKHHIVANSSFSWWGAWLSTSEGIKIAPLQWYADAVMNETAKDLIPSTWIRM